MRTLILTLIMLGCSRGPEARPDLSQPLFDSGYSTALDGYVDRGRAVVSSDQPAQAESEIREQLMYAIGQLNGFGGGAEMARLALALQEVTPRADGRFDAKYTAKLFVAWPREHAVPATMNLVVPAGGDAATRSSFLASFGPGGGSPCYTPTEHDISLGIFWYYYRPMQQGCALAGGDVAGLSTRLTMRLAVSDQNTTGKSPEYGKVWEDQRLVVTAIFGMNEPEPWSENDAGVVAFRTLYDYLVQTYPLLSYQVTHDDIRLELQGRNGVIDAHLYLVKGIRDVDQAFIEKYESRTAVSDFVSYSGHSGLGANVRALARMGRFTPGQYQIYFINGCDSFAYVDQALADAHVAVNPEAAPTKYLDIVTNAMPAYFHMNAAANYQFITAMDAKQGTYRQILAAVDSTQRAVVMGEEDNNWPRTF